MKSLCAAFAPGDAASALAPMDREMVWNEAENFPYADHNPYVGPMAIASGVFLRLATEWDQFQAIPEGFVDSGDIVVAVGRYRAHVQGDGVAINAKFAHVWWMRTGRQSGSSNIRILRRRRAR